jgi:hypothetical protein
MATDPAAVERIREIIAQLVSEREQLRRSSTDPATLEANRLSLSYWQTRLAESEPGERRAPPAAA